jgi:DNA polymerase III epsilon subunit-like protein
VIDINTSFVAIDLETSCLPTEDKAGNVDFGRVAILSIGAELFPPMTMGSLYLEIEQVPDSDVSAQAMSVNGLANSDGAKLKPEYAINELLRFIRYAAPGAIVGHNLLGFDLPLLGVWARRLNIDLPRKNDFLILCEGELYDTMALWRAYMGKLKRQEHESSLGLQGRAMARRSDCRSSVDALARIFLGENPRSGTHNALEDAKLAGRVFMKMALKGILEEVL